MGCELALDNSGDGVYVVESDSGMKGQSEQFAIQKLGRWPGFAITEHP